MLAKARADASAARLLATHEDQDDGIIGFHAQQACEKALKAVLAVAAAATVEWATTVVAGHSS